MNKISGTKIAHLQEVGLPLFLPCNFFLLHSFPHGTFSYKDTDGYWVLGGTEGSKTFKGIIGHTRIYRRHFLFPNQVLERDRFAWQKMFGMALI